MDNKKIDNLIDEAFAKDKATIPEQPDTPPASLLDKVRAAKPAVPAGASSGGAFASLTMKVIGLVASLAVVVTVLYVTTKSENVRPVMPEGTAPLIDTIQTALESPSAPKQFNDSARIKPKTVSKDSTPILPATMNSDKDLIIPVAAELYEKDTATGKLKKK